MEDNLHDRRGSILIIGYGNPLRGDDALGPYLIGEIAALQLPMVRTKAVHQLLPELAAELANHTHVIFIDAHDGPLPGGVAITSIEPSQTSVSFCHRVDAESLLALTRTLYGRKPTAQLLKVAGENFDLREGLSEVAKRNAAIALRLIEETVEKGPKPHGVVR
jgi:hydrogenase maturation protease